MTTTWYGWPGFECQPVENLKRIKKTLFSKYIPVQAISDKLYHITF